MGSPLCQDLYLFHSAWSAWCIILYLEKAREVKENPTTSCIPALRARRLVEAKTMYDQDIIRTIL